MDLIARFVERQQAMREAALGRALTPAEQRLFRLMWGLLITSPLILVVIIGTIRAVLAN
jgi:hypothetical protein